MLGVTQYNPQITHTGALSSLKEGIPVVAGIGVIGLSAYDVYKAKPEERKEHFIRNLFLLTAGTVLIGLLCKKWLGNHPAFRRLFHKSEHAMEHIAAHTSHEASVAMSKASALRNLLRKSSGKTAQEVELIVKRALPEEGKALSAILKKYGIAESEAIASKLSKELPYLERELPYLESKLPLLEAKLPYFEETAERLVAQVFRRNGPQIAAANNKLFLA